VTKAELVLIIHNVRSCHNVGSMLRSADAFGINKVYLTGYTPYPQEADDTRLPHLAAKIGRQIAKTSLGAENTVKWAHRDEISELLTELSERKYTLAALEQAPDAIKLADFKTPDRLALIVGREVEGIEPEVLEQVEYIVEIPMLGEKESLNVSVAAAVAMYQLKPSSP
jgi:23S rRNA (guanosine2251-2'-O)-methyltransferase